MACGNGILGLGGLWGGACGACNNGCGCGGDDRKIAVITAVRAVAASGDGCFDGRFL